MTGEPVSIHFKEGIKPHAVYTPIPVPHHWKEKVKRDIDRDVELGIIEKVPQETTSEWCARMIITPKKNGDPRQTVDLQQLNKATLRETHHTPSPFNLISTIPTTTRKTVLDPQRSSQSGEDIAIYEPQWDYMLLETHTPGVSTKSGALRRWLPPLGR